MLSALAMIPVLLAPLIPPDRIWYPAFFGLAYLPLLLVNFSFVVFWLLVRRSRIWLSLIAMFMTVMAFNRTFGLHFFTKPWSNDMAKVRIMSYNVHLFDLYSWKNPGIIKDSIMSMIQDEQPDILCMQEFFCDTSNAFNTEKDLSTLGYEYQFIDYSLIRQKIYKFGIGIVSKYPIIGTGRIDNPADNIGSGNYAIYADMLVDMDTIRVYNLHLQSIYLNKEQSLFDPDSSLKQNEFEKHSRSVLRKLKSAFEKRAIQVRNIREHIKNCRYDVFVCGDFNDTPVSYAYRTIKSNLNDAFLLAGAGLGKTYAGLYPSFRIDYIFSPKHWDANNFRILRKRFSDHYPIICDFRKGNK